MTTKKGKGPAPAPLDPKVAKKLLDRLSTDNAFRRLFKKDAGAALAQVGYKLEAGAASAGGCMQLQATDRIAPKAKITKERAKLEQSFAMIWAFACPAELKA